MLAKVALSAGGVGIGMLALKFLAKAFLRGPGARLLTNNGGSDEKQRDKVVNEVAGGIVCITHHLAVTGAALRVMLSGESELIWPVLLLEVGFDVSDTIFALIPAVGSMTGMGPLPVSIHHCVALLLESAVLINPGVVPASTIASMLVVLIGSGAVDMLVVRLLRHTPIYASKWMLPIAICQFGLFLASRLGLFSVEAFHTVRSVSTHASGALRWSLYSATGLLTLFHLLLGTGMVFALRNGGRMPEKPKAKHAD